MKRYFSTSTILLLLLGSTACGANPSTASSTASPAASTSIPAQDPLALASESGEPAPSQDQDAEPTIAVSTSEDSNTSKPNQSSHDSLPDTPLTYAKPLPFSSSGISGTINRVAEPSQLLKDAAEDSGKAEGTWFAVELTNESAAELRPQLINLHTLDDQHFQAYGEVATAFTFAKDQAPSARVAELKDAATREAALAGGESKTTYFYSVNPIPDGFSDGTIQFLLGGSNLVIELPGNNS